MKYFIQLTIMLSVPVILFLNPVFAQNSGKVAADNVQKTVLLDEVNAILANHNDSVVVRAILGKKGETEIKQGDIIFMALGKPVASVSDLMTLYDKTGKKETFKIAVKRGNERFLTSFDIDPKSETGREMFTGTMKFPTSDTNNSSLDVIPDLLVYGIMAAGSDDGLIVKQAMPNLDPNLKQKGVGKGDRIVSINGKNVSNLKVFKEVWDDIPQGEQVTLEISKKEKNIAVKLIKKNVDGKIIFNKEG